MSNDPWAPQGDPHHTPHTTTPHAPTPYGYAPTQPSTYPHTPAPRRSGPALASLVVGIIALLLCLIPIINIVSVLGGITAVVLGIVGIRKVVPGVVTGKGMAVAGIITGAVATVVAAVVLALMGAALNAIGSDEFQRVVEEAIEEAEASRPQQSPAAEDLAAEPDAADEGALTDDEPWDVTLLTCADIADEAMAISEGDGLMTLVEITELAIDQDHRADYDVPSGSDQALVLSCTGTADWEDGSTDPVILELSIDGTGEIFVAYDLR